MCLCNTLVIPSGVRGFLGVVSQPGTLSLIEMGWVWLPGPGGGRRHVSIRTIARICPGGEQGTKEAVQECQLEPWHLGEGGTDPGDYGFRFRAGGRWFNVQVILLVLFIPCPLPPRWRCRTGAGHTSERSGSLELSRDSAGDMAVGNGETDKFKSSVILSSLYII